MKPCVRGARGCGAAWPLSLLPIAVFAAGCAIPTQGSPNPIAASKVPFHLLDPQPPTTTTTQPKPSSYVGVKVFFLNANANNALTPVDRLVSAPAPLQTSSPRSWPGRRAATRPPGSRTAIPSDVTVLSASTTAPNVVTVNFGTAFAQITGTATEQAVAQAVSTVANEVGLGTGVIFEIAGQRTSVPIANGSLVAGPVYLLQFFNAAT